MKGLSVERSNFRRHTVASSAAASANNSDEKPNEPVRGYQRLHTRIEGIASVYDVPVRRSGHR